MQAAIDVLAQVYCEVCHLATPLWRKKCIHCGKPFEPVIRSQQQRRKK